MARKQILIVYKSKSKKRKGIHSKNLSRLISSKGYKKKYRGQGR